MRKGIIYSILGLLVLVGCGKQVSKSIPQPVPPGPPHAFINGPLVTSGDVTDQFSISPNSQKVVYIADEDTDGVNELYVSNIDGTNKQKISQPLSGSEDVVRFKISPDSQKVAYVADYTDGEYNLYTVNIDGTQNYQVNAGVPNSTHNGISDFYWLNTSTRLAFTTDDAGTPVVFGLYLADYNGSNRVQLQPNVVGNFSISNNGARIVYRDLSLGSSNPTLRSVASSGNMLTDVLLNTPFDLIGKPASNVSGYIISPNSNLVLYRSNMADNITAEIYVVNIDGSGGRVKMSGTMVANGNVAAGAGTQYNFTPDSTKVVYIADQDTDGVNELYMNTVSNAGAVKISGAYVVGSNISRFQALNNKVVYLGDTVTDGVNELFVTDFVATVTKLNSFIGAGEQVMDFVANSTHVAYLMDKGTPGIFSVYGNSLTASGEQKISHTLTGGPGAYDSGSAAAKQIGMGNDGKVYFRSGVSTANYQGYRVDVTGGAIETLTNESTGGSMLLSTNSLGSNFLLSADGTRCVYRMSIAGQANLLSSKLP